MSYTNRKMKSTKKTPSRKTEKIISKAGPGYLKITETPSLYRARVRSPSKFKRFAFSNYKKPGMRFLYGYPSTAQQAGGRIQAVIFDKSAGWTPLQVKREMAHLSQNPGWMK